MIWYGNKNKYGNKKVKLDGYVFDSKKEGNRYLELKLLERAGAITALQIQPKFKVIEKTENERAVYYIGDFMYSESGRTIVEDVKSEITRKNPTYVIKRKLFRQRYDYINFREV